MSGNRYYLLGENEKLEAENKALQARLTEAHVDYKIQVDAIVALQARLDAVRKCPVVKTISIAGEFGEPLIVELLSKGDVITAALKHAHEVFGNG